ncbi:3312_t:CDS:2, partial [Paraglomus occultum]
ALKSIWMSTDRDISFAENSALRKRYCNFLRILSEERDSERGRTATLLLQKDETHEVKEFWECVNLDKKLTKERITIKKKTELDALK